MKSFFIAAGGTFGHIRPALVLKHNLEKQGYTVHLFCAKKDKKFPLLQNEKNLHYFNLYGLPRTKNLIKLFFFITRLSFSLIKALYYFIRFMPKTVTGCGGFVSFPILFWARFFKKSYFIVEQNSVPGLVSRIFMKKATQNFFAMEPVNKTLLTFNNVKVVGNPLDFTKMPKNDALNRFGLTSNLEHKKVIGVLGGSLGALKINEFIVKNADFFKEKDLTCILVTGKKTYENYKKYENSHLIIKEFVTDMQAFYCLCDFIVARAGASTVSELLYFNIPTVFIPYPHATENHQYHNALFASQYIKSFIINEKELERENLFQMIQKLEKTSTTKNIEFFNGAKNTIIKAITEG